MVVSRGSNREKFRPDYVLFNEQGQPSVVFDAKSPEKNPEDFRYQVSGYAHSLNSKFRNENPVLFAVTSNGYKTVVWKWDEEKPLLILRSLDLTADNSNFIHLQSLLSYEANDSEDIDSQVFEFRQPEISELLDAFNESHHMIWKKEKLGPTDAFYEFTKLIFVKLREDQRISRKRAEGKKTDPQNFVFSIRWINQQIESGVSNNPVADVLFKNIREELEISIAEGSKKRIFNKNEKLNLKASTISEVVKVFENLNLHEIDEDLNGRMFETFLNATVRGKELGQFFTPRSVVKYMTNCADLNVSRDETPTVLDGCCGSGGFLIEAMAQISQRIKNLTQLSDKERNIRIQDLCTNRIYGIEANDKLTRVARLNMYLHGDGGSCIYTADTLDKDLVTERGSDRETLKWLRELKSKLKGRHPVKFDVILTNPPFSMSYKKKDKRENKILVKYDSNLTKGSSVRSNILFLERYYDLLAEDGELLTVIDNTVLNGTDSQNIRDFILKNFVIRQVVSLPFNTFIRAEAGVQTSILHLKKKSNGDEQGNVFMGILNNIGHDDHKRLTPERDNTKNLLCAWEKWNSTGDKINLTVPNSGSDENLGCPYQVFIVEAADLNASRLDAFYYSLELKRIRRTLKQREANGVLSVALGNSLTVVEKLGQNDIDSIKNEIFRYFDIGDVTKDGQISNWRKGKISDLPTRARLRVRKGDVIFAKNISSRGKTIIVPPEFDYQLVSTGFIAIRPDSKEHAFLLWSIMTSEMFKDQIYYLAITAVQPEVREEIFKDEFRIPIPSDMSALVEKAKLADEALTSARSAIDEVRAMSSNLFS